ncbi:5086_t:CDS:2, partial [Funneliformis mosseae]
MLEDLPENAVVTLTFNFVNCKHSYHKYLVEGDKLNNVELSDDQIILKTPDTMKDFVEQGVAQQYSLHNMENIFWKYLGDCIRANSIYYNESSFSNMLINMSKEESEDYNTYESVYFGKVLMLINIIIKGYSSFDFAL